MSLPSAKTIRALGLPGLGEGEDDKIDLLIAAADTVLADRCYYPWTDGRKKTLEAASYTQFYDRPDRDPRQLSLGLHPITVTSIAVDQAGDFTWSTTASLVNDVLVDTYRGIAHVRPTSSFGFVTGRLANRIIGSMGWDVSAEPPLVQAIALLVGHWQAVGQVGTMLAGATSQGSSAQFRDLQIPPAVLGLLGPYTLWEREGHWSQP